MEDGGSSVSAGHGGSSVEVNRVKNACIKFARGRFDIIRYLGYSGVDEGDVCSTCNLIESCGKAYITPKDDRDRTMDVDRILLSYAVNPKHLCGEEISCIEEHVQKCEFMNIARNSKCFRCQEPHPKRGLNPGEWECRSRNNGSNLFDDHSWSNDSISSFRYVDRDGLCLLFHAMKPW
ncbi:hypothetical protein OPV22_019665 [Ensete ventricosum]|uniref:Uncharacterized protein n=1 Tax=Ensete ventricosum TaxID=4639 RepID=A0AAV8QGX1_ENSVE|nr:hypothetical protein OPV22_019665 [Ensete ventricosum]